jgi:hypothetical protein
MRMSMMIEVQRDKDLMTMGRIAMGERMKRKNTRAADN